VTQMTDESSFSAEELAAFRAVDQRAVTPARTPPISNDNIMTSVSQPSAPTRMTPPASATMTPEQSVGWNDWCIGIARAEIGTELDKFAEMLGTEVAIIGNRIRADLREAFATALDKLRTEHAIKMEAMQQEIIELKIANAYERGRNAGVIIDLPALPSRKNLNA
jgi:hypothetical protein